MMNSVSILGCGWLGMAVAVDLLQHGFQVKGSTTQEIKLQALQAAGIEPYLIYFDPDFRATNAVGFFNTDVLIITIPPRRKSGQTDTYLQQLDSVVAQILQSPVRKIIFISSTSVYRESNSTVTEQHADPASYLLQAEAKFSNKILKTTVLRFGGLYGPGRHPGKFLAGKKDVKGGDNPINVIHQDDCVAIIRQIIQQGVWSEVFNACSDQHPTKREFYTKACLELALEPPQFLANDQCPYKIVSSEKLKQALPYRFIH